MSTEMQRLERARPQVAPPTRDARAEADARLRKAILAEAPGAQVAPGLGSRPRGWRHNTTAFVWLAGSAGALIVAVAALVLLHHRTAAPGRGAAAGPAVTGHARGAIVTSDGATLAGVQPRYIVRVETGSLPSNGAARRAEFGRLDRAITGRPSDGECRISRTKTELLGQMACIVATEQARGLSDIVLATGMAAEVVRPILRDRAAFPGVVLQPTEVRSYPQGELAAQLLGTVGPITAPEAREPRYDGVSPNAIVGQSGLEYQYDRYLRAGDTLHLSISTALQRAGERSLAHAIAANRPASGGAFVVMNPQNGQVLALGSAPTYHPDVFTRPITESQYHRLFGPESGDPQFDRAIASAGPVGSVFAPLTGLAAAQSGAWPAAASYDDTGRFCFPNSTVCLHNAGNAAYGALNLARAITVSDGVFFYHLGDLLNADPVTHPNGGALQQWAHAFGIGQATGVDLPGEASGALPSPRYLAVLAQEETQCEHATGPFRGHPKHPASQGGCGISNARSAEWTVGDNINTAVGQGDLQITPLQVAVAYAAIANGGAVVTPHVGASVTAAGGATVATIDPPAARHLRLDPGALTAVRTGLRAAVSAPGGTARDVFGNFPEQVYGKSGTAEINGKQDNAWFVAYVPASATSRPILVVVTVEQGGFGAVAAAPVARQILSQWFFGKPGPYVAGTSTTL